MFNVPEINNSDHINNPITQRKVACKMIVMGNSDD